MGKLKAQEELYRRYSSRLFALCMRYIPDRGMAEDCLQDAFVKILSRINRFHYMGEGSLYAWMSRVTINYCIDCLRKKKMLKEEPLLSDNLIDTPFEGYPDSELIPLEKLMEFVNHLPDMYRAVFQMSCINGFTHSEISRTLGIKEKSVASNLTRARASLSKKIMDYLREIENE